MLLDVERLTQQVRLLGVAMERLDVEIAAQAEENPPDSPPTIT